MKLLSIAAASLVLFISARAAEPLPAAAFSAADLASRLSAQRLDGDSYVRLRLEVKQPAGTIALQLQIKSRSSKAGTELVYQVLWPKERKGETVLLRKPAGRAPSGTTLTPPDTLRALDSGQMKEPLFGSDLTYEDVLENAFAWDRQTIVGTETVERVNCQILESKPGKADRSSYASVKTWVDTRRMVPLRIEKYLASGQLARRIETLGVANDDRRHPIPSVLSARGPRPDSVTELDGSRIRHDVHYEDREFTPEGLKEVAAPAAAPE